MMNPTHQLTHRKVAGKTKRFARRLGGDMSSCRECMSQQNQHPEYPISPIQDNISVNAAVGSEGDMFCAYHSQSIKLSL